MNLRYVIREGEKVLQQERKYYKDLQCTEYLESVWIDVPTSTIKDEKLPVTDFEKALEVAAEYHVRESNECEVMDDYRSHEDTFSAGARWARSYTVDEILKFLKEKQVLIIGNIGMTHQEQITQVLERNFKESGDINGH